MSYYGNVEFSSFVGKTFKEINVIGDEIEFIAEDNDCFVMYHEQDCSETVYIESIIGDVKDLIGTPILVADESKHFEHPLEMYDDDSFTWTFYKLATINGGVEIRWYGSSNGNYSECVSVEKVNRATI